VDAAAGCDGEKVKKTITHENSQKIVLTAMIAVSLKSHASSLNQGTKKPGVTWGNSGFANVCFVSASH
jgi:predicted cobalt transporter CbtA